MLKHFVTAIYVARHIKGTIPESTKKLGFGMILITRQQIFQILRHRFSNNKTIEAETLTGITTVGRKRNRQQRKKKRNKRKEEKQKASCANLCELLSKEVKKNKCKRKQIEKKKQKSE